MTQNTHPEPTGAIATSGEKENKKSRNYRLSNSDLSLLAQLAAAQGKTQTGALETAIRESAQARHLNP